MRIVNLTQRPATPEQKAAGVFGPRGNRFINFLRVAMWGDAPSKPMNIEWRASGIAGMVENLYPRPDAAMIDGAHWLAAHLARELLARGIRPLHEPVCQTGAEECLTEES